MQLIPLQATPNQQVQVQLGSQTCTLNIQQMAFGLFLTLYVGSELIVASVLCLNLVRIIRDLYLGFDGDLCFYDSQGTTDPVYTGFGSSGRYQLVYLDSTDLDGEG